jgi:hypothetical protein
MTIIEFQRSVDDRTFRAHVRKLLDEARENVGIIAGEFGAYRYPELREGVQHATHRGVGVDAYGNRPDSDVLAQMTNDGVGVTVGPLKSLHHYFVADGTNAIVSFKEPGAAPTQPGTRWGRVYLGEPDMALAINSYRHFLEGSAKGVQPSRLLTDLVHDVGAHPTFARRIRIADNVLSIAGVETPPPTGLVEAMLASFGTLATNPRQSGADNEAELALVNQIALVTASMALSQSGDWWDAPVVSIIQASQESVDEARLSMQLRPRESSPRHSIWESPS